MSFYPQSSSEGTRVVSSGGCGFLGLLQIAFIILKLCGVITWSWPVVLIPLWISLGFFALMIIFIVVLAILYSK